MWFVGTTQPHFEKTAEEFAFSTFLSRDEKLNIVNRLDSGELKLPLCIGHAGGNHANFEVPEDWRMGGVEFAFLDGNGALMMFGQVDEGRLEAKALSKDIKDNKTPWGLSLWTEYGEHADGMVVDKNVTHVGVTPNPDLAEYCTYIHHCGPNRDAVLRTVRDLYLKEEGSFATEKTRALFAHLSTAGSDLGMYFYVPVVSCQQTRRRLTRHRQA